MAERYASLRLSQEQLQALTAGLLTAQEEEKERLARELHDDLNQRLAALVMKVGHLEPEIPGSDTGEKVRELRLMAEGVSEDVRRLAHHLHPSVLAHFGLARSLHSYCEEFWKMNGIQVRFRQRSLPKEIPEDVTLCLYRVVQEALGNTARHSQAKAASVLLAGAAGGLRLLVRDDGTGFDADAVTGSGLGLVSMKERVRLVGGSLSIKSRPGGGTRIEVSVPLPRGAA